MRVAVRRGPRDGWRLMSVLEWTVLIVAVLVFAGCLLMWRAERRDERERAQAAGLTLPRFDAPAEAAPLLYEFLIMRPGLVEAGAPNPHGGENE